MGLVDLLLSETLNVMFSSAEVYPTEIRPVQNRATEIRPVQNRPTKIRPIENRPVEFRKAEFSPAEVRPTEFRRQGSRPQPNEQQVAFSLPLETGVKQILVTGKNFGPVSSLQDLSGKKVFVNPLTTYYDNLQKVSDSLALLSF